LSVRDASITQSKVAAAAADAAASISKPTAARGTATRRTAAHRADANARSLIALLVGSMGVMACIGTNLIDHTSGPEEPRRRR
jgi:peptidyl-tRNA hydrolase